MIKKWMMIFVSAALMVTLLAGCQAAPDETESTTAAESTTVVTETTEGTTQPTATETTQPTESTTEADSTPAFLKDGCWYFYDDEDKAAYAFVFGDDGQADIAYFSRENVEGDDAKYFEGSADYQLDGDTLTVSNIPSAVGRNSFELTVDGEALRYNGIALEQQDRLSLDYPFAHFNR
ncbi:MAG: hypothetical protein IJ168_01280 [Eubacterium sp.]|nr:hypothetical protein [Eubacterium sp.]